MQTIFDISNFVMIRSEINDKTRAVHFFYRKRLTYLAGNIYIIVVAWLSGWSKTYGISHIFLRTGKYRYKILHLITLISYIFLFDCIYVCYEQFWTKTWWNFHSGFQAWRPKKYIFSKFYQDVILKISFFCMKFYGISCCFHYFSKTWRYIWRKICRFEKNRKSTNSLISR